MNPKPPALPAASKSRTVRWLAWGVLILIGGTLLVAVVAAAVTAGSDAKTLSVLVAIALFVVVFFALQFAFHPVRGRTDESHSWKERFPAHTDQEFERFLRVVGKKLGIREKNLFRLHPDDRVTALTQEAFFGDGMDIIELVMAIEEEYALELPDAFLEQARTLGDLFDYVTRLGADSPSASTIQQSDQPKGA
jgi:acyl carrier protein